MSRKIAIAVAVVVAVVAVGAGSWAAFGRGGESVERGTCGGNAWELSVEDDDGGLEVSYELQAGRPGETWQVRVEQGDTVLLEGERVTDDDAELDLDAPARADGADDFTVTAVPTAEASGTTGTTGTTCTATLTR